MRGTGATGGGPGSAGTTATPQLPSLWLHSLAQVLARSIHPTTHSLPPSLHPVAPAHHHRRATRLKLHMHSP